MSKVFEPRSVDWAPWPVFSEEQVAAVASVLTSGKINQWTGSEVWEFERDYAAYLGRTHAVAVMNGTVALELALKAFEVGPGHEVITTPRSFLASASSIVLQGAVPIFADVDPDSGNITAETIEKALTPNTRAIVVVHLAGWPADMPAIMELVRAHDLIVIEDCAQAHGAEINGRPVGSFGHAAAFSFCQDKIITTGGEGGLVALDDEEAWNRAWSYKDHGKSYSAVFERDHPPGFRWLHESFGSNWRMTEMQAVLGRLQLRDLEEAVATRNRNAGVLHQALSRLPTLRVPTVGPGQRHAYYKFYAYTVPEQLKAGWNRDRIQLEIEKAGIPVTSGSCSEMYLEKAFETASLNTGVRLPVARQLGDTSLLFQVHPGLSDDALQYAVEVITEIVSHASR